MDQILEGLFNSDQPDKLKEAFVARICEQGTQGSQNEHTVRGVLQVSSRWILNGTTTLQVKSGFLLLKSWGSRSRDVFHSFFTPNLVAEMLTHGFGGMEANVPLLLREGFRVMSQGGTSLDSEHVQVVQGNITKFVCKTQERVVVRNVGLLLREFPECIPPNANEKTNFCVAILHHLSVGVPPEQGQVIPKFINNTDEIAGFLNVLWTPYPSSLLETCLATIFSIISASRTEEMSEPAICLAAVVKHIPIEMANRVVKDVVTDRSITDASLEAAVGQIVEWLKWPTAVNVDMWLLCFLSELAKAQKYTLLVRIIEASADQVAETLAYPNLRRAAFRVLSQMLLGFHHSPGPFHKCLEKIPIIVHVLRSEGTPQSGAFLKEFSELIYDLMYQHTGFPELYEPVLELIKDFPQPSVDEIKIKLNQIRWLTQAGCTSVIETAAPSLLVSAVKQEKLELGKTGLENLGNTCYMNSVLQALYMCDQFRRGVLARIPLGKEGLLVKLQHVFAQLSQSSRPAIAPSKFLQSSRPPWFLPGHQQDCSEFLKYLLDQLHEDEKSSASNLGMKKSQSAGSISPNGTIKINTGTLSKAERRKAVVMLTSLKMKTEDEINSVNGSGAGSLENDKCSESIQSLVERTFRGKVQTTLRCLACQKVSSRVESFADIPLAFPNSSRPMEYLQKNLAGGNDVAGADVAMESMQSDAAVDVDLSKPNDSSFTLNDLISFYLKPEKLTGDNMYQCDQCGKLQDGERTIQIVESPHYLILTLLRFSYDTKLQTRTKIFQDVRYPRTLAVPVCDALSAVSRDEKPDFQKHYARSSSCASPRNGADLVDLYQAKLENIAARLAPECEPSTQVPTRCDLYGLTSVIVHSGASSECGHYYCYARHSQTGQVSAKLLDKVSDNNLGNLDLLSDRWYSFNDSRVSHATFDSFSNVTKKFSKDTAYVLIYRKLACEDLVLGANVEPVLRSDLRDAVIKDNELYLKEQELEARAREEQRRRRSSSVNSANLNNWQNRDDDDDDSHKGHPGYTSGIGSGLDITGSRFVF
ncbi:unnamed protein product [Candidula unifasciata]|uniref:USP domain-containing protein n=1 Tax=Candidula unifasciata TaxID=100452 RepID=A0A8S3YP47_9EUPU|nr:unnamed protein product [Candidula unifasciata]